MSLNHFLIFVFFTHLAVRPVPPFKFQMPLNHGIRFVAVAASARLEVCQWIVGKKINTEEFFIFNK
jgi:hypothetical protein